jgi:PHP family Zn ribbon phosphoesterase
MDTPIEELGQLRCCDLSGELLARVINKMRRGEVLIRPGFDGEYGEVSVLL